MKVYSSNTPKLYRHKPNFTSNDNEWHIFGIDEGGRPKRDYIRNWHNQHYMPYQETIYNEGYRLSQFDLKQLLSSLVRKPFKVNNELINQLHLQNLDHIDNSSYKGEMIKWEQLYKVEKLYEAGIRRIIVIGRGSTDLEIECKRMGMEYLAIEFEKMGNRAFSDTIETVKTSKRVYAREIENYDETKTAEYVNEQVRTWIAEARQYIDEFTLFIQMMKKGNIYLGCELGSHHSDRALIFDYLFNPNKRYRRSIPDEDDVSSAENLYHNLTDVDKSKMGWPKDFDRIFFERLGKLKKSLSRLSGKNIKM